ncbi:hypothetical protein [Vibrio mediterranei]|uniref:hypothetical protein n=1 Tax=Vibrio mediterranei TaxID=689 RepID=UPI004067DEEF
MSRVNHVSNISSVNVQLRKQEQEERKVERAKSNPDLIDYDELELLDIVADSIVFAEPNGDLAMSAQDSLDAERISRSLLNDEG